MASTGNVRKAKPVRHVCGKYIACSHWVLWLLLEHHHVVVRLGEVWHWTIWKNGN
jgi:hypothetical protein